MPCVPAILLLDISPKDLTTGVQTNTCTHVSIVALSSRAERRKPPKHAAPGNGKSVVYPYIYGRLVLTYA